MKRGSEGNGNILNVQEGTLLLENMQNIAKCCCVTNVEANLQPDFFVAVSGLVFMPDYMDLCNGGVACQGKDSPSV